MQKVLALLSIVLVTLRNQLVSAQACENLRQATSTFVPACEGSDIYVKWPNYENASSYYICNGNNNPKLMTCATELYYCYVQQSCVDCSSYIPPPPCEDLYTETPHQCTPINGGTTSRPGGSTSSSGPTGPTPSTLPTPIYPGTGSTPSSTAKTTTTTTTTNSTGSTSSSNGTTTTKNPGSSTPTMQTPPVIEGSTTPPPNSTDIPPPPSPTTQNTLIPTPPTPPPTPPNVSVDPPYVSPKPAS